MIWLERAAYALGEWLDDVGYRLRDWSCEREWKRAQAERDRAFGPWERLAPDAKGHYTVGIGDDVQFRPGDDGVGVYVRHPLDAARPAAVTAQPDAAIQAAGDT